MKRLFILFGLIGFINVTSGIPTNSFIAIPKSEVGENHNIDILKPITPSFTNLSGTLFLAIDLVDSIVVADGDVVEFVFENRSRFVSFHINDINQDMIDTGSADLFVMVHHDLARALKAKRLKSINVIHKGEDRKMLINSFWIPDQNFDKL